jgi:hypothetical protein
MCRFTTTHVIQRCALLDVDSRLTGVICMNNTLRRYDVCDFTSLMVSASRGYRHSCAQIDHNWLPGDDDNLPRLYERFMHVVQRHMQANNNDCRACMCFCLTLTYKHSELFARGALHAGTGSYRIRVLSVYDRNVRVYAANGRAKLAVAVTFV